MSMIADAIGAISSHVTPLVLAYFVFVNGF